MKIYAALAAVLAVFAFTAARAEEAAAPAGAAISAVAGHVEKVAPAAAENAADRVAPAVAMPPAAAGSYAKDRAECDTLVSAASTEGAELPADVKAASLKKCLIAKGHSDEEVTKEEAAAAPAPDAAPVEKK